jgi:hypothetical protein
LSLALFFQNHVHIPSESFSGIMRKKECHV